VVKKERQGVTKSKQLIEGDEMQKKKSKTPLIKLSLETQAKLDKAKIHPRETYEDVIKRLLK